jgi:hypothetical protein
MLDAVADVYNGVCFLILKERALGALVLYILLMHNSLFSGPY